MLHPKNTSSSAGKTLSRNDYTSGCAVPSSREKDDGWWSVGSRGFSIRAKGEKDYLEGAERRTKLKEGQAKQIEGQLKKIKKEGLGGLFIWSCVEEPPTS